MKTRNRMFFNKPEVHASDIDRLDQKLFLLEKIRSYQCRQPVNRNRAHTCKKHYRQKKRKAQSKLDYNTCYFGAHKYLPQ